MKVCYRANGQIAELSDEAARQLIDAGICDAVDEMPAPTAVPPMTTDSMPARPKRVR